MRYGLLFVGIISLMSVCVSEATAAEVKAMECTRSADGDMPKYVYEIRADLAARSVDVTLTSEQKEPAHYPLPVGSNWGIVWQSDDGLRVVSVITGFSDNPFDSPVMMLDLDFADVSIRYVEAGGLELAPWEQQPPKFQCKRLN